MIIETLPAGKYLVGDPCYAFDNRSWDIVLENGFLIKDEIGHSSRFAGRRLIGFTTAFGDGTYFDQEGREYPVDAGMIGVVPVESATQVDIFGMHVVDFPDGVVCRSRDGVLQFGHIIIDTND